MVDFRCNKTSQLCFLDKLQRRCHFAASPHSLSITQGFVGDPSKKGWLPAGHLCRFWHRGTPSQGLVVLAEGTEEQGGAAVGTPPAQAHRFQLPGDTCPLPPCVVLPANFSHLLWLLVVFCFPSFLAGFGCFYFILLSFYKLFLCFWSLITGFSAHCMTTPLLRLHNLPGIDHLSILEQGISIPHIDCTKCILG